MANALACALFVATAIGFWKIVARHHFQADLSGLWGAGRLCGQRRDPYTEPLHVDGDYFARTHFTYGPLVASLLRPLGALEYETARRVWFGLQAAALAAVLTLGIGRLAHALLAGSLLIALCGFIAFPLFAHFERGQIDLFVTLGAFASLLSWERGDARLAGVLLLLTTIVKLPTGLLFLAPLAARDGEFLMAGGLAGLAAATCALAIEGPARLARYFRVALPAIDRTGGFLPAELQAFPTPGMPTHCWRGRDFRIASFSAGSASLTCALRARFGYAVGTGLGVLGMATTLAVAAHALAPPQVATSVKTVAWLASVSAMLLFQPLTWVMGCVHLIPVGLRLAAIQDLGGPAAVAVALLALALVGLGEGLASRLPRAAGANRHVLGALLLWCVLIWLLAA